MTQSDGIIEHILSYNDPCVNYMHPVTIPFLTKEERRAYITKLENNWDLEGLEIKGWTQFADDPDTKCDYFTYPPEEQETPTEHSVYSFLLSKKQAYEKQVEIIQNNIAELETALNAIAQAQETLCYHCNKPVTDSRRHKAERIFCGESKDCLIAEQTYYKEDPRHDQ